MVRTHGLSHISLSVADPDRSLAFYRTVFGVTEYYRDDSQVQVQGPGPMFHVAFAEKPLTDYRSAAGMDTPRYHRLTAALLERGIRVLERGLWYVSTVHTDADIDHTLALLAELLPQA